MCPKPIRHAIILLSYSSAAFACAPGVLFPFQSLRCLNCCKLQSMRLLVAFKLLNLLLAQIQRRNTDRVTELFRSNDKIHRKTIESNAFRKRCPINSEKREKEENLCVIFSPAHSALKSITYCFERQEMSF
jgi:hypothetical protein